MPDGIEVSAVAAPALPLPTPRIEIRRPAFGESIEPGLSGAYPIELDVRSYVLTREGQGLLVSLNGGRPRRWPASGRLALGDLVPATEEVPRGRNVLFAALVDGEGRVLRGAGANGQSPFFVVDFFIGVPQALPASAEPRLFCLAPVGTHYGNPGDALRLELFATAAATAATVHVTAPGLAFSTRVDPQRPYTIRGLPAGDVRVVAELGSAAAAPARCVATLNPELEVRPR